MESVSPWSNRRTRRLTELVLPPPQRLQVSSHPGHHRRHQPSPNRRLERPRFQPPHLRARSRRRRQGMQGQELVLLHRGRQGYRRGRLDLCLSQHPNQEVGVGCRVRRGFELYRVGYQEDRRGLDQQQDCRREIDRPLQDRRVSAESSANTSYPDVSG